MKRTQGFDRRFVTAMVLLGVVIVGSYGCAGSLPSPLQSALVVSILPPLDSEFYSMEQGGATAFEVGSEQISFEVQMPSSVAGEGLVASISGLPVGVQFEPSSAASFVEPFDLEADGSFVALYTLKSDSTAQPGSYQVTIRVAGTGTPGNSVLSDEATFTLVVTIRETPPLDVGG